MKIKLIRTGGLIPVKKAIEADIDISDKDMHTLLNTIRSDPYTSKTRDGNYYELTVGESSVFVDMEKVPDEYKKMFDDLRGRMRIVK